MNRETDLAGPAISSEHSWFRVSDYVGWQKDGSLQLRPKFQRGSVWRASDKSLLIDSLLKGFPIPLLILQDEYPEIGARAIRRVVDGQQRLRTLIGFIDIKLLGDEIEDTDMFTYRPQHVKQRHPGFKFADLDRDQQLQIMETRISAVILNSRTSEPSILEVYDRLNRTGTKLSAQELRWAKYRGGFSELCYRITRDNQTRWHDWGIITNQSISQMGDVELTSELILLILDGIQKTGKPEIDVAYEKRSLAENEEEYVIKTFNSVFETLGYLYDSSRSPDAVRPFRTKAWLYSLFSMQLFRIGALDQDGNATSSAQSFDSTETLAPSLASAWVDTALGAYKDARKSDAALARAVSGGASDKSSRLRRLEFLIGTLES
ncbi:DUF262 domain-containing protein [Rhodococcus sp. IEGM 1354]|uniref:DUF262 domain-containing protein n=1 Tax=Rhodococcus sp. IEGM 1354 TaxID=3047088 RepID=UPI0024B79A7B|nr:DUF262 domain-containing protein [Rhodococcus sp. IEGM 1354]MDI9929713.1 DUF262 domain-containing protein [Rhodococcus sp. IEGM 1354]